jgi:hypothetical protein
MEHLHENTTSLSPEQRQFNDLMKHGDDFTIIEIFRYARIWYKRALELHVNDELALQKIQLCDEKLRFERKAILWLIVAAVIIITAGVSFRLFAA